MIQLPLSTKSGTHSSSVHPRQNFRILPPVERFEKAMNESLDRYEAAMMKDSITSRSRLDQTADWFVWWILAGLLVAAGVIIWWGVWG